MNRHLWSTAPVGHAGHRILGVGYGPDRKDPTDDGPEVAVIRAVTHRSDWYYRIRLAVPKFVAWCRKVGVL